MPGGKPDPNCKDCKGTGRCDCVNRKPNLSAGATFVTNKDGKWKRINEKNRDLQTFRSVYWLIAEQHAVSKELQEVVVKLNESLYNLFVSL